MSKIYIEMCSNTRLCMDIYFGSNFMNPPKHCKIKEIFLAILHHGGGGVTKLSIIQNPFGIYRKYFRIKSSIYKVTFLCIIDKIKNFEWEPLVEFGWNYSNV